MVLFLVSKSWMIMLFDRWPRSPAGTLLCCNRTDQVRAVQAEDIVQGYCVVMVLVTNGYGAVARGRVFSHRSLCELMKRCYVGRT